jgi:hydroxyacyl-ACP dehydratase HTD2-like protein with hotdog domain
MNAFGFRVLNGVDSLVYVYPRATRRNRFAQINPVLINSHFSLCSVTSSSNLLWQNRGPDRNHQAKPWWVVCMELGQSDLI